MDLAGLTGRLDSSKLFSNNFRSHRDLPVVWNEL